MSVAPSFADILALGKAEAQARRPDLPINDGDVTDAILRGGGAMSDAVIRFAAQLYRSRFLDGAQGAELDSLIEDLFGIPRTLASQARTSVNFSRTSSGSGGTIAAGTQIGTAFTADGEQVVFTTDTNVSVGGGANGPFAVNVTAVNAGRAGNVRAGKITQVISSLFDTFTVTNAADAAGGNDVETDAAYRARARSYFSTLRRGTLAALEQGALEAKVVGSSVKGSAGVRFARANEDSETAGVTVLVCDQDGGSTHQMVADVEYELDHGSDDNGGWRAAGALVQVRGGQRVVVDLKLRVLKTRRGFDAATVRAEIVDAITARLDALTCEEIMHGDGIEHAAISVSPNDVLSVEVVDVQLDGVAYTGGTDIVPDTGQTLRAGTITVEVA